MTPLLLGQFDIALLTYEKFTALALTRPHIIEQVGTIVIGEVQMIADESRGANLEFIMTLLRMRRREGIEPQIIALSAGGLRAVDPGEMEFGAFHSHGIDMFESNDDDPARWQGAVLLSCSGCHEFTGIHSLLSYSRARFGAEEGSPPKLVASNPAQEIAVEIQWIRQHHKLAVTTP